MTLFLVKLSQPHVKGLYQKEYFTTFLLSGILMVIFATSCNFNSKEPISVKGEAQGTYYSITYIDDQSRDFQPQFDSLFKSFDLSASVYVPQSVISRFNKNDSSVVADPVFEYIFNRSMEVSEKTEGAFDITVMPLVNAWGFGFTERSMVDSAMVDSLLPLIGYHKVRLENGKLIKENPAIMIDFNAIAQGYTCDVIGKYLETKGIDNYLVDVGGEVLAKGTKDDDKQWIVGIEKPSANADDERSLQGTIHLKDKALATSGSYRKYFTENGQRYSHTIDPKTGYPVNHSLLSVSVMANDCITADAYATAFMVMGLDKAKKFLSADNSIGAYIIYDDHGTLKTWASDNFPKLAN